MYIRTIKYIINKTQALPDFNTYKKHIFIHKAISTTFHHKIEMAIILAKRETNTLYESLFRIVSAKISHIKSRMCLPSAA